MTRFCIEIEAVYTMEDNEGKPIDEDQKVFFVIFHDNMNREKWKDLINRKLEENKPEIDEDEEDGSSYVLDGYCPVGHAVSLTDTSYSVYKNFYKNLIDLST